MSYYIKNKLSFGGYEGHINELYDKILNENGEFCFNNVVPVQNSADEDRYSLSSYELDKIFNKCQSVWGCGAEAIDVIVDKNAHTLTFTTKYDNPDKIVAEIAKLVPQVNIHWEWCGEDPFDDVNGNAFFSNGKLKEAISIREGTIEALNNWCDMWGENIDYLIENYGEAVNEAKEYSAKIKADDSRIYEKINLNSDETTQKKQNDYER